MTTSLFLATPLAGIAALAVICLALAARSILRKKRPTGGFSFLYSKAQTDWAVLSEKRRVNNEYPSLFIPGALRIILLVLIAVSLARPQKVTVEELEPIRGVDIMLVLDTSASMQALDFQPFNRLQAAKKIAAEFIEKRTGEKVDVTVGKGRVNIKGKKGEMTFSRAGDVELPEGFPKDVPVDTATSIMMAATHLTTFSLVLQTDKDFHTVENTYRKEMTSQGWEEDSAVTTGGALVLQYRKANRSTMVRINVQDERTQVFVMVREREE